MTNRHIAARAPDSRQGSTPRPNPASTGRRMKRNVQVGDRRTTIVMEAYVWDCIDSMLHREDVTLDAFCNMIKGVRRSSSMASSARLIVLAYFRLLGQINTPPFVDPDIVSSSEAVRLKHRRRHWAIACSSACYQALCARRSAWSIAAPGAVIFPVADATDGQPSARINASSSRITLAGASGP